MSHLFETVLETRCNEDGDYAVLRAQWDFDKRLLERALQSVGHAFPHYSSHDASHSRTILVQVERVLGSAAIERLSATDIWLLLEAAYYHDTGMIVTNAQLEEVWSEPAFRTFLADLKKGGDRDLSEAATWLEPSKADVPVGSGDGRAPTLEAHWPLRIAWAVRMVIAEYRRRAHAAAGELVVRRPEVAGIASPRTGLIPPRLFGWLGRICSAHGGSFDDVMSLPQSESGVARDEAHPRFVACLLRLGDLLDLDNGRFCPTMLACAGRVPDSSRAHIMKHASIRRLQVNTMVINVEAVFTSEDAITAGYEVCATWLQMLREELARQQGAWTQIVPESSFRPLPCIGTVEVRVLNLVSRGHLEIDVPKVMKLLQGANFYKDTSTFIREVLQNSVDATLLRLWVEKKDELVSAPIAEQPDRARALLNQWPITVEFERVDQKITNGSQRWRLRVTDSGIGIARDDVDYIRNVGSSGSNPSRRTIIDSNPEPMPEWLRPAGVFGIGLQSLFLVTDEVKIETRAVSAGQPLRIRLLKGVGQDRPRMLVEELPDAAGRRFGTTLECELELPALPERISWPTPGSEREKLVKNFDGLIDREMPVLAAEARDSIIQYAQGSWVPINLRGKRDEPQMLPSPGTWHFDSSAMVRVSLSAIPNVEGMVDFRYRGAPLDEHSFHGWPFLAVLVDVLAGTSDQVLTLDRSKFRPDTVEKTLKNAQDGVERILLAEARQGGHGAQAITDDKLSLALRVSDQPDISSCAGDGWRGVTFADTDHKFGDLVSCAVVELCTLASPTDAMATRVTVEADRAVVSGYHRDGWINVLRQVLQKELPYRQLCQVEQVRKVPNARPRRVLWGKKPFDDIVASDEVFKAILSRTVGEAGVGVRRMLPCRSQFSALGLIDEVRLPWVSSIEPSFGPKMISPFTSFHDDRIEITAIDELVRFVTKNSRTQATKASVAGAYEDFVRRADALMSDVKSWQDNKRYSAEDAILELRRIARE